jgi:hypothetical protein
MLGYVNRNLLPRQPGRHALAIHELMVHLEDTPTIERYRIASAELDESLIDTLDPKRLSPDWYTYPAPPAVVALGDAWLAGRSNLALRVPSAVLGLVDGEYNYLLNPLFPGYDRVLKPGAFRDVRIDPRLKG